MTADQARVRSAYTLLIVFLICVLGAFAGVALTGCTAQQQEQNVQLIDRAQAGVDSLARAVEAAQAIVDAYQAQLSTLPDDDDGRHSIEENLASAGTLLARARFDLKIAEIGLSVLKPPATQPAAK